MKEAVPCSVLVRGCGDVGSAVAHALMVAGHRVAIHDEPRPPHTRRGMSFTDALFEGTARLDGLMAKRVRDAEDAQRMVSCGRAIPIADLAFAALREAIGPDVLVDARMRKREVPEGQRGLAAVTIGLGPNFEAGIDVDLVVETGWGDDLGRVITRGRARPLAGEPRKLGGFARERFAVAPVAGVFRTSLAIGDIVFSTGPAAMIHSTPIAVPMDGMVRGVCRDGAIVAAGAKVLEIDPRGEGAQVFGVGERPARIAAGVMAALQLR